jgi:alkylation response protein AidB-like acyl-CoA dehydrogenase
VPAAERRRCADGGAHDAALWKQMASELGLQGILVPEALGGQGMGFLELGVALEEAGRVLLPAPLLATSLAILALRHAAGDAQQRRWLPALAAGSEIGTLAVVEDAGRWDASGVALEARVDGAEVVLDGCKPVVLDADAATLLVVAARLPETRGAEGVVLAAVPRDARGVRVVPLESLDPLRRQARVELDGARGEPLGAPGGAGPALERTVLQAAIALAAEMVGGAQRCLDMAVGHARQRIQFARPIGSFQAVQHRAAEVLLDLELARSAAWWALWVADEDGAELAEAAHLAKSTCGDAFRGAAEANVQIHGGIGFTWEHDAQLYFKRAHACDVLFGDAPAHRAALARRLGF